MSITIEAINLSQVERQLGAMKEKAPKVLKLAVNDTEESKVKACKRGAENVYS